MSLKLLTQEPVVLIARFEFLLNFVQRSALRDPAPRIHPQDRITTSVLRTCYNTTSGLLRSSRMKVVVQGCKSLRWSPDADEMLCRIPEKQRRQVAREVETAVKTNRGTEVNL